MADGGPWRMFAWREVPASTQCFGAKTIFSIHLVYVHWLGLLSSEFVALGGVDQLSQDRTISVYGGGHQRGAASV
jgi:hypothetical protein